MTRLFLTGAGGFAGHHFLDHTLDTTEWDVVASDSFRHRGTCNRITDVTDRTGRVRSRTTILTHDLRAPFSLQEQDIIAGADGLDYLVALASESHVDRSITDPVPFVENNVSVILNTLELARVLRPKAVIVISTDEVYGPVMGPHDAHSEWEPILPSNPYAASKAAQEAIAISYWRTYGVPVIITNTMNLIGERQHPEKFIPKAIRAVLAGEIVTVHGTLHDVGSRHYLHARNMADAVLFLLRNVNPVLWPDAPSPNRFNIASPDRISNLTLAQMIADAVGKPLRYRLQDFHSARPGHDPHYGLNPGLIHALGWKAPVPFAESLVRTVRWTVAHPEWLAG